LSEVPEVAPRDLFAEIGSPSPPLLLDVREAAEREISVLPGDVHIPMSEVPARLGEIDAERRIVVYCRTGNRSGQVVRYLQNAGFEDVRNLAGGINAWAETVDPSLPVY
jgi:sulfur-carrier protein adenylyltransferase/sulfurtransferase